MLLKGGDIRPTLSLDLKLIFFGENLVKVGTFEKCVEWGSEYLTADYYPPASEASRKVANLTEIKNPHTP